MTNFWLIYFAVGYIVAVLFASFFKKIFVVQETSNKNDKLVIDLIIERPCYILGLWRLTIILADPEDKILIVGFHRFFELETGVLFLISWLIWPVSLAILAIIAYGNIFGKSLPDRKTSS